MKNISELQIFDPVYLQDILDDEPVVAKEIIDSFWEIVTNFHEEFMQNVNNNDISKTHAIAHNIYGIAANIGFEKMAAITKEISNLSKENSQNNSDKIKNLFENYQTSKSEVEDKINEISENYFAA